MPDVLTRFLRRLDFLPIWVTIPLGVLLATWPAYVLASGSILVGALGFSALLGLACAIAISGQPVEKMSVITPRTPDREPEEGQSPVLPYGVELPDMARIPAGSFEMGSPDDEDGRQDDEGPVHTVHLSAFECARYPVTRRLFKAVTGVDPSWPKGDADDRPVNQVTWFDAVAFCNSLSKLADLDPCYEINGESVTWNREVDGFRLPTEAEWERAARAGTRTRWPFGDDESDLREYGWYRVNSGGVQHPVGTLKPNAFGLYDMHGNVWEWCWDRYGPYDELADLARPPQRGRERVLRGGCFKRKARRTRSAYRAFVMPISRGPVIGFRCVRGNRHQLDVAASAGGA
jgi:formylglycine-generating enzyme required for sulfatase activity